jgi:hypothetical protein
LEKQTKQQMNRATALRKSSGLTQRRDGSWEFHAGTLDQHVEAFVQVNTEADSNQWAMAAIAASIEKQYGEGNVQEFAEKVDYTPRHVRRLARTYREIVEKGRYRPQLTFTHHAEALVHPDPEKALATAEDQKLSALALRQWIKDQTPETEQPRERFSAERGKEGSELVEILREQVEKFPAFADELNECIEKITARAARTRQLDREKVKAALHNWGSLTAKELMEETDLSHWDVRQTLADLLKKGVVIEKEVLRSGKHSKQYHKLFSLKRS